MRHLARWRWIAVWVLVGGGCGPADTPDIDSARPATFGFRQSIEASRLARGERAYQRHCVGCHGAQGDGRGEAAGWLDPRPRNFQLAQFKFNQRGVGELPTDEDLKRTIRHGLKGSAMPSFRLLPDPTLDALIVYLKTFSPRWHQEQPSLPIPQVEDPWRQDQDKSEAIARGEAVYHGFAACWACHPAYVSADKVNAHLVALGDEAREAFRETLHESIGKVNEQGETLYPPDFLRDFVRSGAKLEDLYRSIGAGIQGSAMPTWIESIDYTPEGADEPLTTRADVWALAYYVQDLIKQRPARLEEGSFQVRSRPQVLYPEGKLPAEDEYDEGDEYYDDEDEEYEDEDEDEDEETDDSGDGDDAADQGEAR